MANKKPIYYRLSLKRRIWASFTLLTMISIAVTGTMSYYIASRVNERNAFQLSQNTLNKSVQVADERLKHIVVSSSVMMLSQAFKDMMQDVAGRKAGNYYLHLSALQVPFAQMKLSESSIESVLISTPIGDFYPTNSVRDTRVSFMDTDMFQAMDKSNSGREHWVEAHEDRLFYGNNRVISLLMNPLSETYTSGVYLIINVKEEALREAIMQDLVGSSGQFLLLNAHGQSVTDMRSEYSYLLEDGSFVSKVLDQTNRYFEHTTGSDKLLVNSARLSLGEQWVLVSLQSKSALLSQMNLIKWFILIIMIGCILLALLLTNVFSAVLLRPLHKLQRLMKRVEQNSLDVRFTSDFEDEVTQVGRQFNRMLEQIEALINDVKTSELQMRKAEVKALQAQINPHFLYNTLNTILWKSATAEHEDVRDMIVSLSMLFQLGLNNGQEITTLEKEIEHVRQYLMLQQKCYESLFDYEIIVTNNAVLSHPILKILLQPLVENCILHGFEHREEHGLIRVLVAQDEHHLYLSVEDNGSGMDTQAVYHRLEQEQEADWEQRPSKGYALSNVYNRLRFYYGPDSRMILESEPDVKTTVKLIIPLKQGE
ncbi:sensor histidine kinase [Paenibacillus sp. y28]|uniref:sensor histidine kinase n=1 Tax=Paenibacillus sp. y28 TaxID=3129110 RepID=UPI003019982C